MASPDGSLLVVITPTAVDVYDAAGKNKVCARLAWPAGHVAARMGAFRMGLSAARAWEDTPLPIGGILACCGERCWSAQAF